MDKVSVTLVSALVQFIPKHTMKNYNASMACVVLLSFVLKAPSGNNAGKVFSMYSIYFKDFWGG